MQLGMIGLGRMGNGMTERLREHGHDIKTYDPQVESRTAASLEELKAQLDAPRAFWMMVPAGKVTEDVFQNLLGLADKGDTIVDGGNSNFRDSQRRNREAQERGLSFVDAGVSGGIWGLQVGFCMMVGRALCALRVAGRDQLRGQGCCRAAEPVRRARDQGDGASGGLLGGSEVALMAATEKAEQQNPLEEGLLLRRTPDPCAIVIFGAS